jgi:predicted O-methyltransferase YrrM
MPSSTFNTASRKLATFRAAPLEALTAVWNRDLRPRPAGERPSIQAFARQRLARGGALELLNAFIAARPMTALPPDYCDLIYLYARARKLRPEVIVEFGSGCSTVVLAHALTLNGRGVLRSVEADSEWAAANTRALPPALEPVCEIVHSPVVECERFGVQGYLHAELPDVRADFVYVDGPMLTAERPAAFDVFDLKLTRGCVIVVDGRPMQAKLIADELQPRRARARRGHFTYVFELP